MRIIHTSDWHLGRVLYGKSRYKEQEAFLQWLLVFLEAENVDALLISGDIFDSSTPSVQTQNLYYNFLAQMLKTKCKHLVLIAGNHDSANFLTAPKELLAKLDIHIIGSLPETRKEQVFLLENKDKTEQVLICAVPFLRERDICTSYVRDFEEKAKNFVQGVKAHYDEVLFEAKKIQKEQGKDIPIITTGHLFITGGKKEDDEGVRDLYVGSLLSLPTDIFSTEFSYIALGHLHKAQRPNSKEHIRYSGTPLAMSFSEAEQKKSCVLIEYKWDSSNSVLIRDNGTRQGTQDSVHNGTNLQNEDISHGGEKMQNENISQNGIFSQEITVKEIPIFQKLVSISGDMASIEKKLQELVEQKSTAWLEIIYTGKELRADLLSEIETCIQESNMQIIRVQNKQVIAELTQNINTQEQLEDITEEEVFTRLLFEKDIPEEQKQPLFALYREVVQEVHADEQKMLEE